MYKIFHWHSTQIKVHMYLWKTKHFLILVPFTWKHNPREVDICYSNYKKHQASIEYGQLKKKDY